MLPLFSLDSLMLLQCNLLLQLRGRYSTENERRGCTQGYLMHLPRYEVKLFMNYSISHLHFSSLQRPNMKAFSIYDSYGSSLVLVAIETLYAAIQTLVYVLLYSMIGFHWQADKFLYFYYFIFMCFTYFLMYGMMVVALTPGHQIAAIVSSFVVSFWNSFSGFLIPWPVCVLSNS